MIIKAQGFVRITFFDHPYFLPLLLLVNPILKERLNMPQLCLRSPVKLERIGNMPPVS